jgi:hypothetical protein
MTVVVMLGLGDWGDSIVGWRLYGIVKVPCLSPELVVIRGLRCGGFFDCFLP